MSRISEIRIKQTYPCYTVSVRGTINFMNEYESFFEEALLSVTNYLDEHHIITSSPAMVCFHNMELENLEIEVGFHITQEIAGNEKIFCRDTESCKVVSTIDKGPYEKQDSTLMELFEFIKRHNLAMQGPIYYYYLNEPNRDESDYLTQMEIPIK